MTVSAPILISHEWLATAGGSENVFEQIALAFPESDQVCLWNDDPERFPRARETWLARTPLRRHKAAALPFMRSALRSVDVAKYETVVASSHAFGHYNAYRATRAGGRGFAYVHTPARYIWAPDHDERGQRTLVRAVAGAQRWLDKRTATDSVLYAANSEFVRQRLQSCWDVDATVIHPPVAIDEIRASLATDLSSVEAEICEDLPRDYILGASRLIPYKRQDLTLRLAASLDVPVVIAGEGPDADRLKALAASLEVEAMFTGRVSDRLLHELYRRSSLFCFMAVEDFGIMPIEAIAAGAPVLVSRSGGAWEGVSATGAAKRTDPDDWTETCRLAALAMASKSSAGPDVVQRFDNSHFRRRVTSWVGRPR